MRSGWRYHLCWFFFLLAGMQLLAQTANNAWNVQLNKQTFKRGDTIQIHVQQLGNSDSRSAQTLQIWLQHTETKQISKFRYPLLDSVLDVELVVGKNIPEGFFLVDFMVQPAFYQLEGTLDKTSDQPAQLKYYLVTKGMHAVARAISVKNGKFLIPNLLFPDSARICFSPLKKNQYLSMQIRTPLDSLFKPVWQQRSKLFIGEVFKDTASLNLNKNEINTGGSVRFYTVMQEVVVKAKSRKKMDQFEADNVSAVFSSPDAVTIDGIAGSRLSKATDLTNFLLQSIPGLNLLPPDADNLMGTFVWRSGAVTLFLNESKISEDEFAALQPSDIALIKAFRPGSFSNMEAGNTGVIALYTKTAGERNQSNSSSCFDLIGYAPVQVIWNQ